MPPTTFDLTSLTHTVYAVISIAIPNWHSKSDEPLR